MQKTEKYALVFLLLIIFLIRLYHIDAPPLEIEESWRQADTESMARNFAQVDLNPFHPNLNYDGPLPNIPALEIQITTYLIAVLYKVFGVHYFLARIVPVTFFVLSAYYLYLFARDHIGLRGAFFGVLVYGLLPINVYYSRAIMPESAALMFWIGGLYWFNQWLLGRSIKALLVSSLFMSLAIMTKPPVIFVALLMIYLCLHYWGWKWGWLKLPELWIYALVILAVPTLYYYYSASIAEYKFTVGIAQSIIFKDALTAFYSPEALQFYAKSIPKSFGITGVVTIIIGLIAVTRERIVILVWFLVMLLEVIFIVSPIRAAYYLIFFTVPCALLVGNLIDRSLLLSANKFVLSAKVLYMGRVLSLMLILVLAVESYYTVKPMYTINTVMQTQVKVVQEVTKREDLLVVGSFDPCLLSLSDRRGWRYNLRIHPNTPEDPYEELAYYIRRGAKYFVPIQGKIYGDHQDELLKHIEASYPKLELIEGYPVYVLQ